MDGDIRFGPRRTSGPKGAFALSPCMSSEDVSQHGPVGQEALALSDGHGRRSNGWFRRQGPWNVGKKKTFFFKMEDVYRPYTTSYFLEATVSSISSRTAGKQAQASSRKLPSPEEREGASSKNRFHYSLGS